MKVICFRGKGKTGKTTIIRERVLNKFFNIVIHGKGKDFAISFPYKGKLIGICSYGDQLPFVREKIEQIRRRRSCKIIICACRTQGGLLNYLESEFGKNINWIERNSSSKYFGDSEFRQFKEIFNNLI